MYSRDVTFLGKAILKTIHHRQCLPLGYQKVLQDNWQEGNREAVTFMVTTVIRLERLPFHRALRLNPLTL